MLNVASPELSKLPFKKYQCGGFSVNTKKIMDIVTDEANIESLLYALEKGILVDITDNVPNKEFNLEGSHRSKITTDGGFKVFVQKDENGHTFLYAPSSKEEQENIERQLTISGTFKIPETAKTERALDTEISGITNITLSKAD